MPPLTRAQLEGRRSRRRRELRRDPRALIMAAIPLIIVAVLALVLGIGREDVASQAGPLASPVPSPDLGSGARPPDVAIARADGVEVHIPVDPQRVTAAAFHAINDPSGVAMEASGALHIQQSGRDGRAGPDTAALDVGAPAGTAVYAPVDGTIASVSDYMVLGRIEGYEVTIAPSVAATGLVLRLTHLDPPTAGDLPSVGDAVRAGVTPLGRVRDFSNVAEQELSHFTSDSGNHVHMELIRTEAGLIL
jgi:murein DD-endopeptidase MepM/ murein hydrolase activator NlpD